MLAKRIVPTLLVRGRTLVKGERYDGWRSIGNAVQAARVMAKRSVDELILLDINATLEKRAPDMAMVRELSEDCFIPITVGGGVRKIEHIDALLRAGADKVAICAGLVEVPGLLRQAADRFGSQAIVAVIEHRGAMLTWRNGTQGAKFSELAVDAAERYQAEGAGEIMLSNVTRDGTMEGYDLSMIEQISRAVDIPVIASGGCRDYDDMLAAFKAGASACAAGAMFAFTDQTPRGAAAYINEHGLEARV